MIYFIRGTISKNIKIGQTVGSIATRFAGWQSSDILECLTTIPGGQKEEKELHLRFEHLSSHGEWFFPSPELLDYINSLPKSEYAGWKQNMKPSWSSLYEWTIEDTRENNPIAIPRIKALVKGIAEYDGKWRAFTAYLCPLCQKRHQQRIAGKGSLPRVFVVRCKKRLGEVEITNRDLE
jgi:hypothetical protein